MHETELRRNIRASWPSVMLEYVGFNKFISYKSLAELSGVPESTLHKIAQGEHSPRWAHAMMILGNLPPSATNDVLRPIGVAAHPLCGGDVCHHDIAADIACASAKIAGALRDGRVDHRERAEIRPAIKTAGEAIERWLADQPEGSAKLTVVGKVN